MPDPKRKEDISWRCFQYHNKLNIYAFSYLIKFDLILVSYTTHFGKEKNIYGNFARMPPRTNDQKADSLA